MGAASFLESPSNTELILTGFRFEVLLVIFGGSVCVCGMCELLYAYVIECSIGFSSEFLVIFFLFLDWMFYFIWILLL